MRLKLLAVFVAALTVLAWGPLAPAATSGGGGFVSVSVGDVSKLEGNAGVTQFVFQVQASTDCGGFMIVDTLDGTATTADNDYEPVHSSDSAGNTSITVDVNGDTKIEETETFRLRVEVFDNCDGSAVDTGTGTIINDDGPCAFPPAGARVGGSGNDYLIGTSGNDFILGKGGSDYIDGKGGNDTLCGGDGSDTVKGDTGNDILDGGNQSDSLNGGTGTDKCHGRAGTDNATNCETVTEVP
jgi:Ca2+-binding RTX toxin-like protein